ncbi:Mediator of DNA damage checkpoint protein 1 [Irineochytrium annulatum]|nr:Mediator of DNA damage checkpoint protein 1 [Irineochytrium annulatum]
MLDSDAEDDDPAPLSVRPAPPASSLIAPAVHRQPTAVMRAAAAAPERHFIRETTPPQQDPAVHFLESMGDKMPKERREYLADLIRRNHGNPRKAVGRLTVLNKSDAEVVETHDVMIGLNFVGRATSGVPNAVVFRTEGVSSFHAIIEVSPDGAEHFVEDIGSTNGVCLGIGRYKLMERRLYQLVHGKLVHFGPVGCKYEHLYPASENPAEWQSETDSDGKTSQVELLPGPPAKAVSPFIDDTEADSVGSCDKPKPAKRGARAPLLPINSVAPTQVVDARGSTASPTSPHVHVLPTQIAAKDEDDDDEAEISLTDANAVLPTVVVPDGYGSDGDIEMGGSGRDVGPTQVVERTDSVEHGVAPTQVAPHGTPSPAATVADDEDGDGVGAARSGSAGVVQTLVVRSDDEGYRSPERADGAVVDQTLAVKDDGDATDGEEDPYACGATLAVVRDDLDDNGDNGDEPIDPYGGGATLAVERDDLDVDDLDDGAEKEGAANEPAGLWAGDTLAVPADDGDDGDQTEEVEAEAEPDKAPGAPARSPERPQAPGTPARSPVRAATDTLPVPGSGTPIPSPVRDAKEGAPKRVVTFGTPIIAGYGAGASWESTLDLNNNVDPESRLSDASVHSGFTGRAPADTPTGDPAADLELMDAAGIKSPGSGLLMPDRRKIFNTSIISSLDKVVEPTPEKAYVAEEPTGSLSSLSSTTSESKSKSRLGLRRRHAETFSPLALPRDEEAEAEVSSATTAGSASGDKAKSTLRPPPKEEPAAEIAPVSKLASLSGETASLNAPTLAKDEDSAVVLPASRRGRKRKAAEKNSSNENSGGTNSPADLSSPEMLDEGKASVTVEKVAADVANEAAEPVMPKKRARGRPPKELKAAAESVPPKAARQAKGRKGAQKRKLLEPENDIEEDDEVVKAPSKGRKGSKRNLSESEIAAEDPVEEDEPPIKKTKTPGKGIDEPSRKVKTLPEEKAEVPGQSEVAKPGPFAKGKPLAAKKAALQKTTSDTQSSLTELSEGSETDSGADAKSVPSNKRKVEPVEKPPAVKEEPAEAILEVKRQVEAPVGAGRGRKRTKVLAEEEVEGSQKTPTGSPMSKVEPAASGRRRGARSSESSPVVSHKGGSMTPPSKAEGEYRIMFTGLGDDYNLIVEKLGGVNVDSLAECTHLVTDRVRRTVKFLAALSGGKKIINVKWLDQSKKEKRFIAESKHILNDKKAEQQWKFSLAKSLRKAQDPDTPGFLDGVEVFVTSNVKPPRSELEEMVTAAGGKMITALPPAPVDGAKCIVVGCPDDLAECQKMEKAGWTVHTNEILLTGTLRQELDTISFKMSMDGDSQNVTSSAAGTPGPSSAGKKRKK